MDSVCCLCLLLLDEVCCISLDLLRVCGASGAFLDVDAVRDRVLSAGGCVVRCTCGLVSCGCLR